MNDMDPRTIFLPEDRKELEEAIREAEQRTSGEIRIHIERCCNDPVERARELFTDLKMDRTAERNGVLFYIAIESRKYAVLADKGIRQRVPADFWEGISNLLRCEFQRGELLAGLRTAVQVAGHQLAAFFPHRANDVNELPDTISFGDS